MKSYKLINIITGWIVFIIASAVYLMTIEPTASFWDCGEFISTAYKLQVGHPPGAPFFMIVGRFFSLFAKDPENVAKMINALSALSSSGTILFLFWTITHFARKIILKSEKISNNGQIIKIIGSGVVGALAYTFSDTFWFSAVEGEVYAMSSFFTAIVFWAVLKWENVADEKHANRWLVLIAYLMGLSIGVHLLNLLAIPAIVLVYYFKKYKVSRNGLLIALGLSFVILVIIMYGIIPGIVKVASKFELFFVNSLKIGLNTGVLFYSILLIAVVIFGVHYTSHKQDSKVNGILVFLGILLLGIPFLADSVFIGLLLLILSGLFIYWLRDNRVVLNTILVFSTVIVLGYSSFAMIVIRSLADPPMDQNNPETLFGLQYYLNREQYGDRPLFYGQYYSAPIRNTVNTKPIYSQVGEKYEITNYKLKYEFDKEFTTLFPRMYSREPQHVESYQQWGKIKGEKIRTRGDDGKQVTIVKPSFGENLRFFFKYQVNFMYMRYFYWNFVGRQNDLQNTGFTEDGYKDVLNGNWISGIKFIDEARLGPQDKLPNHLKNNKARNTLYFLPLLLGIAGLVYQYKKHRKDFWIVACLFFMTGVAIVLYLNQTPHQPRERDYAYAGSFYAFAIWIGLGVMMIADLLKKISNQAIGSILATIICLILVPGLMASKNWDDHDRSGCYTARDFAYNYLQSCQKNAILFTNGDNDTFPLWYAQEVEGIRTDVRVCNLSYLGADWYIEQMQRKAYDSDPLPFTMNKEQYRQGSRDIVYIMDELKNPIDLQTQAMPWVASDDKRTKVASGTDQFDYFPSKTLRLKVDKQKVIEKGLLNPKFYDQIPEYLEWALPGRYLTKNHLMVLDLLAGNNWERPVYFAITVPGSNHKNLDKYFQICGLAYKIVPVAKNTEQGIVTGVDTDEMFENMVHKFRWGGIENKKVYLNDNNLRMLMNFRNNFAQLAEALLNEGKRDLAKQTLDKSLEVIPLNTVPFDYVMLPYIHLYHMLGDKEKAKMIADYLEQNTISELDYYLQFRGDMTGSINYQMQINLSILKRLTDIINAVGDKEEGERMQELLMDYYNRIKNLIG